MAAGQWDSYVKSNLSKYRHKDKTQKDVLLVFKSFRDLRPKMDTYTFNDGSRRELLCIEGTIPVYYKGNTYNIPVCIWLMDTHPDNPPLCFVKPTPDMLIKPSKYVDANGRIYLPYLHDWKYPASDLIGLIQVMSAVFGENSPVFARGSQPPPRPTYTPGQPMGYPGPARQPAPGFNPGAMPMPMPQPSGPGNLPYQYPPTSSGYQPTPNYQYPPTQYPQQQPPRYPPASQPQATPPYPPSSAAATETPVASAAHKPLQTQVSVGDEAIRASLQSAVEEKLRRKMNETFDRYQAEMDSLTATKDKLQTGQRQLEEMVNKLEQEQVEVEKNIQLMRVKDEEIKQALAKTEGKEELDIDEAVTPTTPLYKQLLNLFSEEMTIEDTYYYLMEALRKDVIDLEVFLKHVRELSRKQFLLRAHIQKARQTAGLRDVGH
ncbi:tumor susceptibility gene 101 protein-like isoform X2 [Amphiura filiformis]|uniref:tumor susceptibility gene 101 protein-like isoform X2 n=1 Tax=Amphiura filiformis TaxID=82378 RepID=UPI003B211BFE